MALGVAMAMLSGVDAEPAPASDKAAARPDSRPRACSREARTRMRRTPEADEFITLRADTVDSIRGVLLADAITALRAAVREAGDEPSEERWDRVLTALADIIGPDDADALLQLVRRWS